MGNVLASVEQWAERQPDKPLYVFLDAHGNVDARYTYAEFVTRVSLIASHLVTDGRFAPGDRLLLAYPAGLEMICAFFACAKAGLVPVPVPALALHGTDAGLYRMGHVARDCAAAGALATREGVAHIAAQCAEAAGALQALPWIATDALEAPAGEPAWPASGEMLFLQYTSGSTSDPKGVIVSHDNVLANARLVLDHGVPITVSWLPQHHDMGLIGYYLNTPIGGGTLYGFSPTSFIQRPSLWLDTISRYRATASSAPNFAFEHCLRPGRIPQQVFDTLDLSSLRTLMAAAEPIKPDLYRAFLQAFRPYGLNPDSYVVAYGLAENTLGVSNRGTDALSLNKDSLTRGEVRQTEGAAEVAAATHIMSCGRPLAEVEVAIVDPDSRLTAAAGRIGEIWVAGESKAHGYWRRPAATAETFEAQIVGASNPPGGYLRTGDMGFLHRGELYVCGRRKDMLIVRGQNYYPQDVETVVEHAQGVRPSGVVAVEASTDGEIVILAEAANRRAPPDLTVVADRVRSRLNLEVDRVVLLPPRALPKTTSGKLMRNRSRQMWETGEFEVLDEFVRSTASDDEALRAAESAPFGFFKAKYRLNGDETCALTDVGLDSMDLVLLLHEFSELLAKRGARELAERVDVRLVQQMSVADLFRLAARFDEAPETALAQVRLSLAKVDEARREEEHALMSADRFTTVEGAPPAGVEVYPPRRVLLTGATGFLGPFLLTSLLEQTEARLYCLVRGESAAHAAERLRTAVAETARRDEAFWRTYERRVEVVCGDLDLPRLGLDDDTWERLAADIDTIHHNGAMVNYLFSYKRMRSANVGGTNAVLELAFAGRRKVFNYVSTTFIYGWATKDVLWESDSNADMELLDFGYSQSKWTAEQVVIDAGRRGLTTRIFRPALVTPAANGDGANFDITLRLLAFMVKYGIGVDALNQVSFMPADVTANNIVAISALTQTAGGVFHVTRDDYANMIDVTNIITRLTGCSFEPFSLPNFVPEVIRRCTREDFLFPLLDFLVGSVDNISAMEFKRYDSSEYQRARGATSWGRPDPSLEDTVAGMLRFMQRTGMVDLPPLPEYGAEEAA